MKRSGLFLRKSSPVGHDFRLSLRSLLPVLIPGILIFTALLPVSTAAVRDFSIFNVDYTHDQLKFRLCEEHLVPALSAAAFLLGLACSVRLFSFMQDKRRSAFYFSLGLSRKKIYAVRTAACLMGSAAALFLPAAVSVLLNVRALGRYEGLFSYGLVFFLLLFLQAATGILIGQIVCFLSGTPGERLLLSVTLTAGPFALFASAEGLMRLFLRGNVYGAVTYAGTTVKEGLLTGLSSWNPVCFSWKYLEQYNQFSRTMENSRPDAVDPVPLLIWAGVLAAAVIPSLILFVRYPAERSGISGLFSSAKAAAAAVWPAAAFAAVLETLQSTGTVTAFAAASFSAVFLYFLIAGIYSMKGSGMKKRLAGGAAFLLLLLCCAGFVKSGFAGFYYRIPALSAVKSMEMTCTGDPSYMPAACSMTQNGESVYSTGTVSFQSKSSIRKGIALAEEMFSQKNLQTGASDHAEDTVYPYDIEISWTDQNGREHRRYFDRISGSVFDDFLQIEELQEWKEEMSRTVCGSYSDHLWNSEAFRNGEIYVTDSWMRSIRHITLSEEMRQTLLQTAAKELSAQGPQERYHPEQDADDVLFFSLNGESDLENMKAGTAAVKIYLTDSFPETLSLLGEWDALPEVSGAPDAGEIRRVLLQKFDPFSGMNELSSPVSLFFSEYRTESADDFVIGQDFGLRPEITDPDQIRQLAEASAGSACLSDQGCLAAFEMNSGEVIYRYIPYEKEPSFIQSKLN